MGAVTEASWAGLSAVTQQFDMRTRHSSVMLHAPASRTTSLVDHISITYGGTTLQGPLTVQATLRPPASPALQGSSWGFGMGLGRGSGSATGSKGSPITPPPMQLPLWTISTHLQLASHPEE